MNSVHEVVSVTPERGDAGRFATRFGRPAAVVLVLLCGLTLLLGFINKDRCTGPAFDQWGRTQPDYDERNKEDVCYSDIQHLWIGRDIDRHVFPYVDGNINDKGTLIGGSVEYPVLSGLIIWAGAIFAHNDAEYLLYSSLLMAPFGLLTGWLLGKLARWRALLWAIGPPLILYAFHNWDLPVVLCSVAAVFVVHRWNRPLVERATVASVLLGLGFAFKVYPAAFVLPLMLFVATGGWRGQEMPDGKKADIAERGQGRARLDHHGRAGQPAVRDRFYYDGWAASFEFQQLRRVDITTNSIWYWGLRPFIGDDAMQSLVGVISPITILISFAIAASTTAGRGSGARAPTRGSRCPARCCAASCCCTRSTRRSTRCGWCRSSCFCACGWPGRSPTSWSTSRWASASSAGSGRSSSVSPPGSTTASPRRP